MACALVAAGKQSNNELHKSMNCVLYVQGSMVSVQSALFQHQKTAHHPDAANPPWGSHHQHPRTQLQV